MPKEIEDHLVRLVVNLMTVVKHGRPISDYAMHAVSDIRKRTEVRFRQHSSKFAWRIAEAADHVLQKSLLFCMARGKYACLMVDGTCRPWLHH